MSLIIGLVGHGMSTLDVICIGMPGAGDNAAMDQTCENDRLAAACTSVAFSTKYFITV